MILNLQKINHILLSMIPNFHKPIYLERCDPKASEQMFHFQSWYAKALPNIKNYENYNITMGNSQAEYQCITKT